MNYTKTAVLPVTPDEAFALITQPERLRRWRTTYTWARSDEGTRMTLRNRGEPSGFARVAAPVMDRAMRRATNKNLARLKAILEGAGGSVTDGR